MKREPINLKKLEKSPRNAPEAAKQAQAPRWTTLFAATGGGKMPGFEKK